MKHSAKTAIRLLTLLLLCARPSLFAQTVPEAGWPTYGGGPGGQRYSAALQITRENVAHLHPAWTYHTHALDSGRPGTLSAAFESTPILFHGTLYLTTPFDHVAAIDAATGAERWTWDPQIPDSDLGEGELIASRGVALWQDGGSTPAASCHDRIFLGTLIGTLIALDATTGKPCQEFGSGGKVDLKLGVEYKHGDQFSVTSAPTVLGDVVVVGSSLSDNYKVDTAMGSVRGYDVRSGRQLWAWDPIPWAKNQKIRTGAANAWSTFSADAALGLIYIPTGSASPDYYGGMRLGDGKDADSVVALNAATGKKVWAFQTVHHDIWDYDVASQPLLFTFHNTIPAVAITTKTGMIFVLDRRDGSPLYPIEERPVPQTDVPGEVTSPTQPFSTLPTLSPLTIPAPSGSTRSPSNDKFCREQIAGLRYDGIYTPPSIHGSMIFPGNLGGVNWGSPALDPATGILYANTNHLAFAIHLIDHPAVEGTPFIFRHKKWVYFSFLLLILACIVARRIFKLNWLGGVALLLPIVAIALLFLRHHTQIQNNIEATFGKGLSPQFKTPYQLLREPLVDHDRNPCVPPPWGAITAINLNTGEMVWDQPLGTMDPARHTGSLSLGGPIATAGGLLFTAATREPILRAFDSQTGRQLWAGALPVPAQSTPMTYTVNGNQFVVIAAGGHGTFRTAQGDSLIAFALSD